MWFHFVAISGSAMRHSALSWPLTRRAYLAHTLALAAAPAWAGAAQRAHQRWVVINLSLEPDSLDPTMAASAAVGEVVHYNVLEGLTRIEENGSVAPLLAQRWQMDARQRTCTLQLRQGVRFHDGTPFNAAAVRFSFERARAPGSTNKARTTLFDNIAHIATPDAHTVVLGLHHADAHLPFRLGENTAVILSPASAGAAATAPVGTGPYRVQQWQRGHSITLAPASTYRHAKTLYMRGATFRFLYTPEAQAAALHGEEMDLFLHFATNSVRGLVADSRYQLLLGTSSSKGLLALNHRRAPLADLRVRRAITHAIDREAFIRTVFEGRGTVIGSHFSPSDPGYLHLAHRYPYDPDRARALLREALGPAPLRLSLALPPPPYARLGGPVLAADLERVGIAVEPRPLEWAQWLAGPFKGDFDMTLITHVEPLDYPIYTDPGYYFGYDSAAFRQLVQRHAQSESPRERARLFAQLQRHLAEDAVNAWLYASQVGTVVRKGLRGVWMHYPIFVHDIAALRWESEEDTA